MEHDGQSIETISVSADLYGIHTWALRWCRRTGTLV